MRTARILISLCTMLFTLAFSGKLSAQLDSLQTGDRIRLVAPPAVPHQTTGQFSRIAADSFYIEINSAETAVPLRRIRILEISRGKKRRTWEGTIIGAGVGGVLLGTIAYAATEEKDEGFFRMTRGSAFKGGLVAGALLGGAAGFFIGSRLESEHWERISLP